MVGRWAPSDLDDDLLDVRVHQAVGMIIAQVSCGTRGALARLRMRSYATKQSLHDTALDVFDRRARFSRS
jgi:hypothetical protein